MREILTALLLVAAVEGLLLAGFPEAMRRAMEETSRMPARLLRIAGFGFAVIGIFGLWAMRHFAGS
ncbi:MAG: DUF2065 domain-containing protein [Proteobacteria bacterium]|nr:DUF2065 domain-containing protein [Pseudomonadota bacterium]